MSWLPAGFMEIQWKMKALLCVQHFPHSTIRDPSTKKTEPQVENQQCHYTTQPQVESVQRRTARFCYSDYRRTSSVITIHNPKWSLYRGAPPGFSTVTTAESAVSLQYTTPSGVCTEAHHQVFLQWLPPNQQRHYNTQPQVESVQRCTARFFYSDYRRTSSVTTIHNPKWSLYSGTPPGFSTVTTTEPAVSSATIHNPKWSLYRGAPPCFFTVITAKQAVSLQYTTPSGVCTEAHHQVFLQWLQLNQQCHYNIQTQVESVQRRMARFFYSDYRGTSSVTTIQYPKWSLYRGALPGFCYSDYPRSSSVTTIHNPKWSLYRGAPPAFSTVTTAEPAVSLQYTTPSGVCTEAHHQVFLQWLPPNQQCHYNTQPQVESVQRRISTVTTAEPAVSLQYTIPSGVCTEAHHQVFLQWLPPNQQCHYNTQPQVESVQRRTTRFFYSDYRQTSSVTTIHNPKWSLYRGAPPGFSTVTTTEPAVSLQYTTPSGVCTEAHFYSDYCRTSSVTTIHNPKWSLYRGAPPGFSTVTTAEPAVSLQYTTPSGVCTEAHRQVFFTVTTAEPAVWLQYTTPSGVCTEAHRQVFLQWLPPNQQCHYNTQLQMESVQRRIARFFYSDYRRTSSVTTIHNPKWSLYRGASPGFFIVTTAEPAVSLQYTTPSGVCTEAHRHVFLQWLPPNKQCHYNTQPQVESVQRRMARFFYSDYSWTSSVITIYNPKWSLYRGAWPGFSTVTTAEPVVSLQYTTPSGLCTEAHRQVFYSDYHRTSSVTTIHNPKLSLYRGASPDFSTVTTAEPAVLTTTIMMLQKLGSSWLGGPPVKVTTEQDDHDVPHRQ